MTKRQTQEWFKDKGVSISTLVVLVTFIIYQSKFQQRAETMMVDYKEHKKELEVFKNDILKFRDNIKLLYVPRPEAEKDRQNILNILFEIKDDVKYLKRNKE